MAEKPGRAVGDAEAFWERAASELAWFRPWTRVREGPRWFVGGETNLAFNCLDRHLGPARRDAPALIGDGRTFTFRTLRDEVCRLANALWMLGARQGDRVILRFPNVPELPISMLACARIGATHCVIPPRQAGRGARLMLTTEVLPDDDADLESVMVLRRPGSRASVRPPRVVAWEDVIAAAPVDCPAEPLESEYAASSIGAPPLVLPAGGMMVAAYVAARGAFGDRAGDRIEWTSGFHEAVGQLFGLYGPLLHGAAVVLEGAEARCGEADVDRWIHETAFGPDLWMNGPLPLRFA
jgi:acetyl-CoA synthetase